MAKRPIQPMALIACSQKSWPTRAGSTNLRVMPGVLGTIDIIRKLYIIENFYIILGSKLGSKVQIWFCHSYLLVILHKYFYFLFPSSFLLFSLFFLLFLFSLSPLLFLLSPFTPFLITNVISHHQSSFLNSTLIDLSKIKYDYTLSISSHYDRISSSLWTITFLPIHCQFDIFFLVDD